MGNYRRDQNRQLLVQAKLKFRGRTLFNGSDPFTFNPFQRF